MLTYDDEEATALAPFTATYPMQPRNPTGSPTVGASDALQLRARIAGPGPDGAATVLLANCGSDSSLAKRGSVCVALGTCSDGGFSAAGNHSADGAGDWDWDGEWG